MGSGEKRVRSARLLRRPATALTAGLVVVLLSLGQATAFPGANGRIAFLFYV